jgi:tripartite-type tricarboxylate transporter receptor subunit TctC
MMSSRTHRATACAIAIAAFAASTPTLAQLDPDQTYPSRPIRLIVPFAAGGGVDLTARAIAQSLTEAWGQPVVVDNRAGANGTIGVEIAAKSPPDGYTLTVISASHSVNVSLYKNLPYDLVRDFAPVTQTTMQPYVLVVNPKIPAASVGDVIALAKAKPDSLNYGSSGIGGLSHLSGALFAAQANIQLTHIPYKGGAPALQDVVGGQIEMLFSTLLQSHAQISVGKLRALAVTTAARSPAAPQLPTMIEAGMPVSWSPVGTEYSRRQERLRRSSPSSTRRWCASCARRRCVTGWRAMAPSRLAARPRNSRHTSGRRSPNGRR